MRTARKLAMEAGVFIHVRNFQIINQVGAVSIDARLDCNAFANTHSATSHYDRQSFVGLAWRPPGESICCEIYSTGRANLPGSVRERDLLRSFSRMLPELLRHSDRPDTLDLIHNDLKAAHRPLLVTRDDTAWSHTPRSNDAQHTATTVPPLPPSLDLWDGDMPFPALVGSGLPASAYDCNGGVDDEALLTQAGF
jgi:hypothetical protein